MVSLSSSSKAGKYAQIALSTCLLGLSAKLITERGSLSSKVSELAEYYESSSLDSSSTELLMKRDDSSIATILNLDSSWKNSAVSIAASCVSLFGNSANYALPMLFTESATTELPGIFLSNPVNTRYLSAKASSLRQTSLATISKSQLTYFASLIASDGTSNIMWFVNMILFTSNYASTSCSDVENLLTSFNLTGDLSSYALSNFFNIDSSDYNDTSSTEYIIESLLSDNGSFTSSDLTTLLDSISSSNVTVSEFQSELLIALGNNCQLKKASVGLIVVIWLTYLVTTGVLTASGLSFYSSYKKLQTSGISHESSAGETSSGDPAEHENEADSDNSVEPLVYFIYKKDWMFPTIVPETQAKDYGISP
ncbi:hypothetical protein CANARDRAFT_26712 [[Candida] arabinofermentans NRRL YB-2248]|uniref:Uncharacterized protein n=1 Tax=[Candida] arabinofermentans NRRL YB-2248 TaxID=983967 RepID=A0A1E4T6B7_9ASCO|nr:hypothetical protein CANARDRAFT_26712 [[Candida] arabinofermentans NRRL YB-2248]